MKNKLINSAFIFMAISLTCLPGFAASPGSLDSSFGLAGFVQTNNFGNDSISDLVVQTNGKIVAISRNDSMDFVVSRYTTDGSLDSSFSGDGRRNIDFSGNSDFGSLVCSQSDNKVVLLGFTDVNSVSQIAVARLNPDGSSDLSFSSDGEVVLPFGSFPTGCAIQPDGKIVFTLSSISSNFATLRLTAGGVLDTTFGTNGFVSTNVGATNIRTGGVKLQTDGKILVFGNRSNFAECVIVRYNSNGVLDTTFNGAGINVFNFSTATENLSNIALQSNERIVLGISQADNIVKVARLFSTGNLDTTFGTNGVSNINVPNSTDDAVEQIFIQSDEKILASGTTIGGGKHVLFRLDGFGGNLDTSFGRNGFYQNLRRKETGTFAASLIGDKFVVGFTLLTATNNTDLAFERVNLSKTPIAAADFDGDAFTDSAVYRPTTGNWFILNSSTNTVTIDQFGANGDIPIDGDFDGDGRCDLAIFRPSNGTWFFKRSSDSTILGATFGGAGDRPIPGDYDKDGKTDMAFFRPGNGNWFVLRSSTNFSTFFAYPFGQAGDIPLTIGGL